MEAAEPSARRAHLDRLLLSELANDTPSPQAGDPVFRVAENLAEDLLGVLAEPRARRGGSRWLLHGYPRTRLNKGRRGGSGTRRLALRITGFTASWGALP